MAGVLRVRLGSTILDLLDAKFGATAIALILFVIRLSAATEQPGRVEPQAPLEGAQEAAERPWWRRVFGS